MDSSVCVCVRELCMYLVVCGDTTLLELIMRVSPNDPTMTLLHGSLSSHNLHPLTQILCGCTP